MREQNKGLAILCRTSEAGAASPASPQRSKASINQVLLAADAGNMKKMVKLLKEVDVSLAVGMNLFTPLHHACNRGHLFIAKLLIDHKCDVDAQNKSLETPLHLAAFNGHLQVAELLLDRHAKCDMLNQYEETPLFYAGRKGHEHMLRLLLQWGADSKLKNRFGESAEDEASTAKSKAVFQTASRDPPKGFASLPGLEVLRSLFAFMEVRDLCRAGCICVRWRRHADAKELWDALGIRKWQVALQHTLTGFSAPAMASMGLSSFARPPRPPGKRRSFRNSRQRPASSEAPKSPKPYSRNRRIMSR